MSTPEQHPTAPMGNAGGVTLKTFPVAIKGLQQTELAVEPTLCSDQTPYFVDCIRVTAKNAHGQFVFAWVKAEAAVDLAVALIDAAEQINDKRMAVAV